MPPIELSKLWALFELLSQSMFMYQFWASTRFGWLELLVPVSVTENQTEPGLVLDLVLEPELELCLKLDPVLELEL